MNTYFDGEELLLLLRMLFAHILVQYILPRHPWRAIALIPPLEEALAVYLLCGRLEAWWLIPFIFVFSAVAQGLAGHKELSTYRFVFGETLIVGGIVLAWLSLTTGFDSGGHFVHDLLHNTRAGFFILAYSVCLWPLDRFISLATRKWRLEMPESEGLIEAGKWIGKLERVLILTFMLLQHFEAIGFLITAKSILRFNDLKQSTQKKEAEYVLIGTLMSFSACILLGLAVLKLTAQ